MSASYQADLRYSRAGWDDGEHAKWTCEHRHGAPAQAARCGHAEIRRLTRKTSNDYNVLSYISFAVVRRAK